MINQYEFSFADELERLILSDANVLNQYIVYRSFLNELYAISVLKVRELVMFGDITISQKSREDNFIVGIGKVRDKVISIIDFDIWMGKSKYHQEDYNFLMLCEYGNENFGILINDVLGIVDIKSENLHRFALEDEKISYVAEVDFMGQEILCSVIDSDSLLQDIHPFAEKTTNAKIDIIKLQKDILIAEDSKIIQNFLRQNFIHNNIRFKIFSNGLELIDWVEQNGLENIGLIITDIEMPVRDGFFVISEIRKQDKNIPIIVNSNMINKALSKKAKELGATYLVNKPGIDDLNIAISKYYKV